MVLPGRLMASTGLLMKFRFLHESRIGLSSGSLTILKYNPQYVVGGDRIKTCPYPYPAVKWAVRQTPWILALGTQSQASPLISGMPPPFSLQGYF